MTKELNINDIETEYIELSNKIKELTKKQKELKEKLIENKDKLILHKVSVVERNSFDSTAFKKEHPDLYKKYLKKSKYEKITMFKTNK